MLLSIEGRPERPQALATIRAAVEAGATLIDTADAYHAGPDDRGHNELLVAEALRELHAGPVLVATTGGRVRPGDGRWLTDGRPEHLLTAARESAHRLGTDAIGLYLLHAPDPQVPLRESLEAVRSLVEDGVVVETGVSNVTVDQLDLAHEVLGRHLACVQNQFSPTASSRDVLTRCEQLGLAFLAWRPLGAVVSSWGSTNADETFGVVANRHGTSVQQVVLAWELSVSPAVIPIPGATRPQTAADSVRASELELDAADLELLDGFQPAV
jgi:aryl-alcohol dehydrogenase-like predicted oxidoreductase